MSTFNIIMNVLILCILAGLYYLSYKLKGKSKTRIQVLNDYQDIVESQNIVIEHLKESLTSVSGIFRGISEKLIYKSSTNEENAQDLALAFKELGYRINEQVNIDDANTYRYSLISGECFNDTSNCLLVLDKIIKNGEHLNVRDIVQDFKMSIKRSTYA